MRRVASLLSITLLLLIPVSSLQAATPKPGTSCTKLNQTQILNNFKYTCQKSGKKLIWGAGVRVSAPTTTTSPTPSPTASNAPVPNPAPSPTPTPTPTASPTPSPTQTISRTTFVPNGSAIPKEYWPDIKNIAQTNFFTHALPPSSTFNVKIQSEPSVTQKNLAYVEDAMNRLKTYLSGYFAPNTTANVISMASQDWGYKTIMALDPGNQRLSDDMKNTLPRQNPDNPNCAAGLASAGGGFAISYLSQPTVVLNIMNCDLAQVGTPPHEFTHSVQINYISKVKTNDPNPGCYGPSWLREGQAQAGNIILSYWNGKDQSLWSFKDILSRTENPSSKNNYLSFLEENDDAKLQQYDLGAFASLYLIARSGWDKSLEVWTESAKLAGPNCAGNDRMKYFTQAFQNVYGQSLSDFYSEVTPYLQWLYDHKMEFLLSTDITQQPGEVKFQLNESCHAYGVEAVLQKKSGSSWIDVAPAAGWIQSPCADKYLPYTYAKFSEAVTLRWKVYAIGSWEWLSQEFTYKP